MRVLLVDDERHARERLRGLVEDIEGTEVVGEAEDGRAALDAVETLRPDVLLLDIHMPGMDGLEVARHLVGVDGAPAVIFTTAFDEHALEAFEARAIDYLMKPVRGHRLEEALGRARSLNREDLRAVSGGQRKHFAARIGERMQLVPVEDVRCLIADQKYVSVLHPEGELLIDESLKSLEEEFGELFLRVHRNALVAVSHVTAMDKDDSGKPVLRLDGVEQPVPISRRQLATVRRRILGE